MGEGLYSYACGVLPLASGNLVSCTFIILDSEPGQPKALSENSDGIYFTYFLPFLFSKFSVVTPQA